MSDGRVVIDIVGDDSHFRSAVGRLGQAVGAGLAVGAAAIGAFAVGAVQAAEAGQATERRVTQIAENMGYLGAEADKVTKRLADYAEQTARQTSLDDDMILATQAKLGTFSALGTQMDKTGGAFDRATKAAIDMAAAGFGSAESNATQLGKALQDPIRGITALNRAGVTFTEAQRDQIAAMMEANNIAGAQNIILAEVERQVGGTAEATATATGKMMASFGLMQENIGGALLPIVERLTNTFTASMPAIEAAILRIIKPVETLTAAIEGGATPIEAVRDTIASAFGETTLAIFDNLRTVITDIITAFTDVTTAITDKSDAVTPLIEKITTFAAEVLKSETAVKAIVAALATWKTVQIAGAIVAATTALIASTSAKIADTAAQVASTTAKLADMGVTVALHAMYAKDAVVRALVTAKTIALTAAQKAATAAQWLLNAAMKANPIGLIIVAIGLLVGAIVLLWRRSETFRNIVLAVWGAVQRGIDIAVTLIVGQFNVIETALGNVGDWFASMRDRAVEVVEDLVAKIRAPIDTAVGIIGNLNPFKRRSPSLVDNVLAGTREIAAAYQSLSGVQIAGPSIGAVRAGYMPAMHTTRSVVPAPSVQHSGPLVHIENMEVRSDADIDRVSRQLARHLDTARIAGGYR